MPKKVNPRRGSLQFWPRKRAKNETARVRTWADNVKEVKLLGFAGYKVGMTHIIITDNYKNSMTKGQEINFPVTIIECPPLKVVAVRFYKKDTNGYKVLTQVMASKFDKEVGKTISLPKDVKKKFEDITDFDKLTVIVHTQPKLTGIGKKKPELFEIGVGGKKDDQLAYAKENLGKEISVQDTISEGQLLDSHAVTKGKGFQGPVKRFGVKIRESKSEKTKRGPGSLGPWCGQGHVMWRIPQAGMMGYHLRTEYNKWVVKIGDKVEDVNPKGGFINYGFLKSNYIIVKGSIGGPKKRLIRLTTATRPTKNMPSEAPSVEYISLESKQG